MSRKQEPPRSDSAKRAAKRVAEFLKQHRSRIGTHPEILYAVNHAELLASDLDVLVGAEQRLKIEHEANEQAFRAAKHKGLCADVVKAALAYYRAEKDNETNGGRRPTTLVVAEDVFFAACAALEKFETIDG